jgi:hypothetical protein
MKVGSLRESVKEVLSVQVFQVLAWVGVRVEGGVEVTIGLITNV